MTWQQLYRMIDSDGYAVERSVDNVFIETRVLHTLPEKQRSFRAFDDIWIVSCLPFVTVIPPVKTLSKGMVE